jgi:heme exporter protein D
MNWKSVFSMGGYALYVWGSYVLTVAGIAAETIVLHQRKKALRAGQQNRFPGSESKS